MSTPRAPTDEELHAFLDGELDTYRHGEVGEAVRGDAQLAARMDGYGADRDALRLALADFDAEPIPAAWTARIDRAMAPRPRVVTTRRYAIAAGVLAMVAGASARRWIWPPGDTILADARAARDGSLGGRTETLSGLVPPEGDRDALLESTLGLKVRAPDLHRFGFQLAKVELFGRSGAGAAQFSYANGQQQVLTIFVRSSDGQVRFDLLRDGPTRICVWQDDVVGAVITARMSAGEMMRVASSAYADLNL